MGWFRKKIDVVRTGVAEFTRVHGLSITYERQSLPDPGAMVYSYETLQLDQHSIIGPGIAVRSPNQFAPRTYPLYVPTRAVVLQGLPTVTGQLVHGPLMDEGELIE